MPERTVITNFRILYCAVAMRKDFFCRNFAENRTAGSSKNTSEPRPETPFNEKTV
jgi:hypothetical protein